MNRRLATFGAACLVTVSMVVSGCSSSSSGPTPQAGGSSAALAAEVPSY